MKSGNNTSHSGALWSPSLNPFLRPRPDRSLPPSFQRFDDGMTTHKKSAFIMMKFAEFRGSCGENSRTAATLERSARTGCTAAIAIRVFHFLTPPEFYMTYISSARERRQSHIRAAPHTPHLIPPVLARSSTPASEFGNPSFTSLPGCHLIHLCIPGRGPVRGSAKYHYTRTYGLRITA